MNDNNATLHRRQILVSFSTLTACAVLASAGKTWAQSSKPTAGSKSLVMAQLVDTSQAQQDVSKDFLIGSRAAWQDINLREGLQGRQVLH